MINRNDLIEALKLEPTDGGLVESNVKYRTINLIDDVLFNELISGVILVEVQEGIVMIPYRDLLGNSDDGYEQLDIDKARFTSNADLDYIKSEVNRISADNLNFIDDSNRRIASMNLENLPYYDFVVSALGYNVKDVKRCLNMTYDIITDLEKLKIETYKRISNNTLRELLTSKAENWWSNLYLINNDLLVLVEGECNCDLADLNVEGYKKDKLKDVLDNVKQNFEKSIAYINRFDFEDLKEEK